MVQLPYPVSRVIVPPVANRIEVAPAVNPAQLPGMRPAQASDRSHPTVALRGQVTCSPASAPRTRVDRCQLLDRLRAVELLDHSSAAITQSVYQHSRPERVRDAVNTISRAIGGLNRQSMGARWAHDGDPPRIYADGLTRHRCSEVSEGGFEPPRPVRGTRPST
jgi:hypothetical protein